MPRSNKKNSIKRIDMCDAEVEKILQKAASALDEDEVNKLRNLVATLKVVTEELEKKRVSVRRLKKMLFGPTSEKTSNKKLMKLLAQGATAAETLAELAAQKNAAREAAETDSSAEAADETQSSSPSGPSAPKPNRPKVPGHGRRGASEYKGAEHTHVPHPTIKPKDPCPKCEKGKLYRQKRPKVIVRLTGSAPIQAKVYSVEWFRCNLCGFIATAPLPPGAGPPEKYDESVTSTIGMLRYGFGMPFNRLARLQDNVQIPLPASTQWGLVDHSAAYLEWVFMELIRQAARGSLFYNGDTTMRVLELMAARDAADLTKSPNGKRRTGIFTTGVISTMGERKIALYFTGRDHAGENLETVLRSYDLGPRTVIQMSDGLSRNEPAELPEGLAVIKSDCMGHGRRKYVEIVDAFPDQCLHVLLELQKVYKHDAETRRSKMTPQQRLEYHQQHSRGVMDELKNWLQQQLDDKLVESNSGFGEATRYMLKRWERLTRFLTVAGAPLDNNICERALKRAIRHRKNSLFYKTLHGARVGDIYMSLIHTCELNGVNPFDYLTALIRHGERLAERPEDWMPWNYSATQKTTTGATAI